MNRRAFLASLAAVAVAPMVPSPVPIAHVWPLPPARPDSFYWLSQRGVMKIDAEGWSSLSIDLEGATFTDRGTRYTVGARA